MFKEHVEKINNSSSMGNLIKNAKSDLCKVEFSVLE